MLEHFDEIEENSCKTLDLEHEQFAADKFQTFYTVLIDPKDFARAVRDFASMNPQNPHKN